MVSRALWMVLRSNERTWRRREPERGVLQRVLLAHLETFVARSREHGRGLPRFVERELYRYMSCGLLAFGFARVHCSGCGRDDLVAFSCKGRGFCPSCGGRRMADSAAHLVDEVLPDVPVRQWVLSFPFRIRYLLAYDPKLCCAVRRIFVRSVLAFLESQARQQGHIGARSGAVVFVQRFGSAINLNLHFHALVIDGAYSCAPAQLAPKFRAAPPLEDEHVAELARTLQRRVTRYLERKGHLPREPGQGEDSTSEPELLALISAASVQGLGVLTPESKPPALRLGARREFRKPLVPGSLCSDCEGFSLHAQVLVPQGQRERLEHLCRYVARPAIATERLSLAPNGRVIYRLRRHWRDGTSAVSFDPLTFIERLAAQVPRPRAHQHTYHGVLAPAAPYRDLIVPGPREKKRTASTAAPDAGAPTSCSHSSQRSNSRRSTWAELLQRVFSIDVLRCNHCAGRRKLIALITDGVVVRKILDHLGLPTEPPILARARVAEELAFDA